MIITDLKLPTSIHSEAKPTIDVQRNSHGDPVFLFSWGPLSIDCTLDDMHTLAYEATSALREALGEDVWVAVDPDPADREDIDLSVVPF